MIRHNCKITNCNDPIRNKSKRLCNKHYLKLMRHGDPNYKTTYEYEKQCVIKSCTMFRAGKGYCTKHYDKLRVYGDPLKGGTHEFHGLSEHPLYSTWLNIKNRCNNPNNPKYSYYGGRGIKLCDSWDKSFRRFLNDMGDKPTPEHTIDRVNNNGDYEPNNCRWATRHEQAINTRLRADNKSGFKGVSWHKEKRRWRATKLVGGKQQFYGYAPTPEGAFRLLPPEVDPIRSVGISIANIEDTL